VTQVAARTRPREPLSRARVLEAAAALADAEGVDAVTMRRVADDLGVEAMSLYHYVRSKDELFDGLAELVADEILAGSSAVDRPVKGAAWRGVVRDRALAAREVLLRHRWAAGLFESRTAMPAGLLAYYDGIVGVMGSGGFSNDQIHHALHALGSRAVGFSQELFDPGDASSPRAQAAMVEMEPMLPNLVGMLREVAHDDPDSTIGWCDDQLEFEFGLDLVLDGLERVRRGRSGRGS
jgi:AcrR family transcriptional regulator